MKTGLTLINMPKPYNHYDFKYRKELKNYGIPEYPYWMQVLEYLQDKQFADKYKESGSDCKNN